MLSLPLGTPRPGEVGPHPPLRMLSAPERHSVRAPPRLRVTPDHCGLREA